MKFNYKYFIGQCGFDILFVLKYSIFHQLKCYTAENETGFFSYIKTVLMKHLYVLVFLKIRYMLYKYK